MSSHFTAQQAHLNQRPQVPTHQNVMQQQWNQPAIFCQPDSQVSHQRAPNGSVLVNVQQSNFPASNYMYSQDIPPAYYQSAPYAYAQPQYHSIYSSPMQPGPVYSQIPAEMPGQAPVQPPREEKKKRVLLIVDPTTKNVINKDFVERDEKDKDSTTARVPTPQLTPEQLKDQKKNEVVSKFNQAVMNLAYDGENKAAAQPRRPSPQPSPAKPAAVKPEPERKEEAPPKTPTPVVESQPEPVVEKQPTPEVEKVVEEPVADETKDEVEDKPRSFYRPPVIRERDSSEPATNGTDISEPNGIQEENGASRVDTPDKEAENIEKLLALQAKAEELYQKEAENIERKEYSSELIYFVREVVNIYKKTPTPCDEGMLKERELHIEGMPQANQNRPKFSGGGHPGVYNFNPQWNAGGLGSGGLKRVPYAGRHSENTRNARKKGSITGRASLDRTARNPPPQPLDNLRKAENAWKPKRRETGSIDDEELKYEKFRKEVRSIFNKITPSTYEDLKDEFLNLNVDSDLKMQKIAIDLVFDKAVEEPKFCTLYTNLCKAQISATGKGKDSFCRALIQRAQSTFQGSGEIQQLIAEVRNELSQLPEDATPKQRQDIQERLDLLEAKEKRVLLGNIKFISHLYVAGILADVVVVSCVGALYESYLNQKEETFLQYGIELIEFVSGTYFKKHNLSGETKKDDSVANFMDWLPTIKGSVSSKIKFMIMNFEDFRKGGFVKEEKGPKTIAQLHQDIKKEEEKNKNERIQYDAMKEREKDRNRNPRSGYGGRASYEKQPVDKDKRLKAFNASANTGMSVSKSGSIRQAAANNKLGRTGGANFYKQLAEKKEESASETTPPAPAEEVEDGWTIAGGKNAVSTARIPSLERKSSNTPTSNGSEPTSAAGSRSASEAPPS